MLYETKELGKDCDTAAKDQQELAKGVSLQVALISCAGCGRGDPAGVVRVKSNQTENLKSM